MPRGRIRKKTRARIQFFKTEEDEIKKVLKEVADDLDTRLNSHGFFPPNEDPEKLENFVKEAQIRGVSVDITMP